MTNLILWLDAFFLATTNIKAMFLQHPTNLPVRPNAKRGLTI